MIKSELLKECIADAKAIQATALANAKAALEEAFEPKLKEMLSAKLQEEAGIEDEIPTQVTGEEETVTEEEVNEILSELEGDVEPEGSAPVAPATPVDGAAPAPAGDVAPAADAAAPQTVTAPVMVVAPDASAAPVGDVAPETPVAPEGDEEINIDELLSSLEEASEEDEEELDETVGDVEKAGTATSGPNNITAKGGPVAKVYENTEEGEEEINLDELLSSLNEEAAEEGKACADCKTTEEELNEYRKTVEFLRTQLSEVNLLNAKLLYTNKLFKANSLNNSQKMKIIEAFDLTKSIREVKLTYAAMNEAFNLGSVSPKRSKIIAESLASKPIGTTKPAADKVVLGEVNEMATRFQTLAGIAVKK